MKYLYIVMLMSIISSAVHCQDFKVVVNQDNSITTITKQQVSNFFLKKTAKWADGKTVVPVDLKANSTQRANFSENVHGKSVSAIKSYWQQAVFAGKGTPPVEKGSDAEVIDYVKQNPGAIGYVSSGATIAGVKQIKLTD